MLKSANVLEVIDKETAKVMLYKHKKCHGCGSCNKHMHPGSIVKAENPVNAKQGEMVDVKVHKKFSLTEFSIVYLLPIAAFFGGLLLANLLFGERAGSVTVGLAFVLFIAAIAASIIFKAKYQPQYTVSIVKVIRPAEPRL